MKIREIFRDKREIDRHGDSFDCETSDDDMNEGWKNDDSWSDENNSEISLLSPPLIN